MDERTDFGVDQIQFELGDLPGWWKWAIALTDWVDRLSSMTVETVGPVHAEAMSQWTNPNTERAQL